MEQWEIDFEWLRVRHVVKNKFHKTELPDTNAILFLIGMQELGRLKEKFTKEEKQDLMHIANCRLLSIDGYYEFLGRDAEGWPHWKQVMPFAQKGVNEQEQIIQQYIIQYFKDLEVENGGLE